MATTARQFKDGGYAIYNNTICEFLTYMGVEIRSEDAIRKYKEENPKPQDNNYTLEDLIQDFTQADGSITLPPCKEETVEWICEMIGELI